MKTSFFWNKPLKSFSKLALCQEGKALIGGWNRRIIDSFSRYLKKSLFSPMFDDLLSIFGNRKADFFSAVPWADCFQTSKIKGEHASLQEFII